MATRMQQRRGTAAEWSAANPVLGAGEIGFETDTKVLKVGDGVSTWNSLTASYLLTTGKAADSNLLDGKDSSEFMLAGTPKTVRIPHTFTISGEVKVPVGDVSYIPPFFVPVPVGQTAKVASIRHRINSGTSVSVSLRKSSVQIAAITVTTTSTSSSITGTDTLTNNDDLSLLVTAVSGTPKNMTVSVYLDYTV